MIKDFRLQVRNGVNALEFKVIFGFLFLINIFAFLVNIHRNYGSDYIQIRSFFDNFIIFSPSFGTIRSTLCLIYPILAIFLFSSMKEKNEKSGMDVVMINRMGFRRYYISLFWSNFMISFFAIFSLFFMNFLLNYIVYPAVGNENAFGVPIYDLVNIYDKNFWGDYIKAYNPYIYSFLKLFINSLVFAIMSNFVYILSFNRFLKKIKFVNLALGLFFILNLIDIFGREYAYMSFLYEGGTNRPVWVSCLVLAVFFFGQVFVMYWRKKYEAID